MTETVTALAYLVAAVCFIMALRGLSSPESARAGNLYGMAGMAIAILTTLTLATPSFGGFIVTQRMLQMFRRKQR